MAGAATETATTGCKIANRAVHVASLITEVGVLQNNAILITEVVRGLITTNNNPVVAAIRVAGLTATLTPAAESTVTLTLVIAAQEGGRSAIRVVETPVVAHSGTQVAVIHHQAVVEAVV